MFRRGKSIERESRLLVTKYLKRSHWGRSVNGYRISLGGDKNVLKLDSGDSCTSLRISYRLLNCTLTKGELRNSLEAQWLGLGAFTAVARV